MKSLRYTVASLVLFSLIGARTVAADVLKSVTVTNNTSYTMVEFYASSSSNSSWDMTLNLFAGLSLAPGAQTSIVVGPAAGGCTYDLQAVLNGESQHAYTYGVNACNGGSWTIQ